MWESLGLKLDHTEEVESEGVTTAHLKVGGYEIELLEPMGKNTLYLLKQNITISIVLGQ